MIHSLLFYSPLAIKFPPYQYGLLVKDIIKSVGLSMRDLKPLVCWTAVTMISSTLDRVETQMTFELDRTGIFVYPFIFTR
jgi:hypothetical protein